MDFKVSYTKANGSIKCILAYKVGEQWRQTSKQGFERQKDAKHWINRRLKELEGVNPIDINDLNMTVKELIEVYKDDMDNEWTYNTKEAYDNIFKKVDILLDIKVVEVKVAHIRKYFKGLSSYSLSTQRAHLMLIKSLFNYAINDLEIIGRNPANKIKIPTQPKKEKLKVITTEEFYNDILPLIKRDDYRLMSKIAFNTGMRIGEIEGLTYDCVKKDSLIVNKQWKLLDKGVYNFGITKSSNGNRTVPVTTDLINGLIKIK